MSLDSELEHLTRWVVGVQRTLRAGGALPPFPAAEVALPEGEALPWESDPRVRGQI